MRFPSYSKSDSCWNWKPGSSVKIPWTWNSTENVLILQFYNEWNQTLYYWTLLLLDTSNSSWSNQGRMGVWGPTALWPTLSCSTAADTTMATDTSLWPGLCGLKCRGWNPDSSVSHAARVSSSELTVAGRLWSRASVGVCPGSWLSEVGAVSASWRVWYFRGFTHLNLKCWSALPACNAISRFLLTPF